jgi:D-proline reductase (dithiol) PrdB
VFVPFRLGQIFGEPDAAAQQRAVLWDALAVFAQLTSPGAIMDLPYRWRRSIFRDPLD